MKRTVRFFHYYRYQWETTTRREEEAGNLGSAAYARRYGFYLDLLLHAKQCPFLNRQAHRYVRLLQQCAEKFRGAFDVVCNIILHFLNTSAYPVVQDTLLAELDVD